MPNIDPAAERLESALTQLETAVANRLRTTTPTGDRDLSALTEERDALRIAVDSAGERIDQTIKSIRALLEDSGRRG